MAGYLLGAYPDAVVGGGSDTLLSTFTVQETSGTDPLPSGSYINGFASFAAGEIPSGSKPELRKADGTTALTLQQFDAVRTNDAGDILLGAFTFKTEDALTAGSEASYKIYKTTGALDNTSALASAGITGSHAYAVEAVDGGVTYTALLSDYIGGSDSKARRSGGVCKEWKVSGPLKNAGTSHAKLWARFYVRLHEDGRISLTAKLMNNYVESGAAISLTSCALKDGATTICSYSTITIYPNAGIWFGKSSSEPWNRYWSANEPMFHVKYDLGELQAGNLIFKFRNTAGVISAIGTAPVPVAYDPDDPDQFFGGLGQQDGTGSHSYLGQVLADDAKALVTQDYDWHQYALSKQVYSLMSSMHFHESTGFYVPVMNNLHASYSLGPDRKGVGSSTGATITLTGKASLFSYNASHYPCWGYYPYFTTGHEEWLDELQAHALGLIMSMNPSVDTSTTLNETYIRNPNYTGTQRYGFGAIPSNNMRGMAWFMQIMDNAAYVTPNDDEAYQYLRDLLLTTNWPCLDDYAQFNINDDANRATLGLIDYGYGGAGEKTLDASWMSGFMGIVVAQAIMRGHITEADNLFVSHHIVKYQIGRFLNGCPYNCCTYNMTVAAGGDETGTNPLITDWADAQVGDGGSNTFEPMIPATGCPTSGFNPLWPYTNSGAPDPQSYPAIAHASMHALNKAGVTGADTVLAYFVTSGEDGTDVQWAKMPQWGIRPNE